MELKKGYKKTDIGVIPSDWDVKKTESFAEVIGGGTPSTNNNFFWNGSIIWVTPTEVGKSKYISDSKRKITPDALEKSSARILPIGTVLLTSRAGIGDVAITTVELCTNQGFQSLVVKFGYLNEFVYYLLIFLKKRIIRKASGSTFLEISPSNIKATKFAIPQFDEQQIIVENLSNIDLLISSLEKLISKKKNIKQGMMQDLLTGKRRLPEFSKHWDGKYKKTDVGVIPSDWEVVRIDEVLNISAGRDLMKETFSKEKTHMHKFPIYSNALTNKGLYGYSTDFQHKGNTVTITARGDIGHSECRTEPFVAIGRLLILTPKNKVCSVFISEFINNKIKFSVESTGIPQLTTPQVSKYYLALPSRATEQKKISSLFTDMDNEITMFEKKLQKYKKIKKGMMQTLLTGEIRLV